MDLFILNNNVYEIVNDISSYLIGSFVIIYAFILAIIYIIVLDRIKKQKEPGYPYIHLTTIQSITIPLVASLALTCGFMLYVIYLFMCSHIVLILISAFFDLHKICNTTNNYIPLPFDIICPPKELLPYFTYDISIQDHFYFNRFFFLISLVYSSGTCAYYWVNK